MNRAYAPFFACAVAVFAVACSDDDDDDDSGQPADPSAPSGDLLSAYVSNNGTVLPGGVARLDQAFALQNAVVPGNNEGVLLDHLGNLFQAGDATANGSVRVFSRIGSRPSLDAFNANLDREIGGGAVAGLANPKGMAAAHGAGLLLIADFGASNVAVYGTAAGGDVAPLAGTELSVPPWDLAYDEAADRLFVAQTDGTVAVFDNYVDGGFAPGSPAVPSRVIVPADGSGTQVSTNLHGIAYDPTTDRLVVSDVGDTAVNDDGALYMITSASNADGDVVPARTLSGPLTSLGNPVDIALDGEELRVAEKENDLLLLFTDVFSHAGGNVAPRLSILSDAPESMVLEPNAPSLGPDVSDIDDSGTALDGLIVTSNPLAGPEVGDIRRLDLTLTETAFFEAVSSLESISLDRSGDAVVSFDDGAVTGGLLFVNRLAKGRDGDTVTESRDRMITGTSTLLVSPKGVEVVDSLGRVLVAENNAAAPSILVFSTSATGDAAPLEVTDLPAPPWDLDYDPEADRLFIALTDGSVAVYDAYFSLPVPAVPDRIITISDGGVKPVQESVNLHGIVYDAVNDTLIVSDVGDVGDGGDGVIYTIDAASTASGLTAPTVRIAGPATLLGNPVDLAYNGQDLFVAEKSNTLILRFNDVLVSAGGDLAPDDSVLHAAPESLCLVPSDLSPTSGGSIF